MFVTDKALVLIDRSEVPSDATFFRFFCFLKNKFLPDHSFEIMSARLCAMEVTPPPSDAETAYAATGDHHLFLLTVSAVLAAAIQGGFKDKVEFMRYDVPAAFLQRLLPTPCYGRLPPDLPEPYGSSFVKVLRCIYGAESSTRSSTKIIRSSSSPWATSNLKAIYESLRSPAPTTPTSSSST